MYINLDNALAFLLVMVRMTGILVFNPIFGRRNVPVRVNLGLALLFTICISGLVAPPQVSDPSPLMLAFYVLMELAVGMAAGLVMQLILSVLIIGGDVIDMNMGISMAKAFDPGTNATVAWSTNFLNAMYIVLFFVTNNHLTFLRLAVNSFRLIPLAGQGISADALYYLPEMMGDIFIFGINLSLPIVILEIVMTVGIGIIMRVVPQINVFVVSIQIKLFVGMVTMFVMIPAVAGFLESLITISFERMTEVWALFIL